MTRILAVTLRYPPYVEGGYELLTRDAVHGLRAMGHDVAVLCGVGAEFENDGFTHATLKPTLDEGGNLFENDRKSGPLARVRSHYFRAANYAATKTAIDAFRPDLVLYFNLGLASLAPLLAARMQRVPTLGYLCDRWAENLWLTDVAQDPNKRGRLPFMRALWAGTRSIAGLSPALCASEWIRKRLLASGLAADGVEVLPTGLSPQMDALARATDGPCERIPGGRLRLISTSMLWHGKGQHVLVEAFGRAVAEGLDGELILAGADPGGGEYEEGLRELVREARIEERVEFVGLLSPEELSSYLTASHIFVLPSIWGEPFGLATIEAMAHGLCTIVTDSGASSEVVGDAGVVVPSGEIEALARVLLILGGDEQRRMDLGGRARARAFERFGRATFLSSLESACLAVVAGEELVPYSHSSAQGDCS